MVENESGLVTSARTWHNDLEAFQFLGFNIRALEDDSEEDAHGTEQSEGDQ